MPSLSKRSCRPSLASMCPSSAPLHVAHRRLGARTQSRVLMTPGSCLLRGKALGRTGHWPSRHCCSTAARATPPAAKHYARHGCGPSARANWRCSQITRRASATWRRSATPCECIVPNVDARPASDRAEPRVSRGSFYFLWRHLRLQAQVRRKRYWDTHLYVYIITITERSRSTVVAGLISHNAIIHRNASEQRPVFSTRAVGERERSRRQTEL